MQFIQGLGWETYLDDLEMVRAVCFDRTQLVHDLGWETCVDGTPAVLSELGGCPPLVLG